MKLRRKLRIQLVIMIIFLTSLPISIVGWYILQKSVDSLEGQVMAHQLTQINLLKANFEAVLMGMREDLLFLSQYSSFTHYLNLQGAALTSDSLQGQDSPAEAKAAASKAVENVLLQKRQLLEQDFLLFSKARPIYQQVRYLNEQGLEIVRVENTGSKSQLVNRNKLQNQVGWDYFKQVMKLSGRQVWVSPLGLFQNKEGEVSFKPVIYYGINVYYNVRTAQKAGILIFTVDARSFLQALGTVRLIDEDGFFLNHPDPEKTWGGPRDRKTGYDKVREYGQLLEEIQGREGVVKTAGMILSYQTVSIPESKQKWLLVAQQELESVLGEIKQGELAWQASLGMVIVLALGMGIVISIRLGRPLEELAGLAEAISLGQSLESTRIEGYGNNEFGQLAEALERMRISMVKALERVRQRS